MSEVFVALGSNIDPNARLQSAARLLKSHFPDARFSTCYRNAAVGFEGEDFINAVVSFVILAAVVFFFIVKPMNALMEKVNKPVPPPDAPAPAEDIVLLREIRDSLKKPATA